ncbi:MAG: ParB/RepB/Spo0J family partition protein [Bacillales bacterium]|nr:ParB/RepB/Spo0J family partition protein [Bacillales bacterium]
MENRKRALGMGLEQLFNNENLDLEGIEKKIYESTPKEEIVEIDISELRPNPYQPRKEFDPEKLTELAVSIKEHGIIQPIIVKKSVKGYEIIAGERRYRASKLAGLDKVPAIVRPFTDEQMAEISLLENIQRENLNPIEEALAYKQLLEKSHMTHENLSTKVGKSRSYITNVIGLLRLPSEVQELVSKGKISMGHARALSKLESDEEIIRLAHKIDEENITVRDVEDISSKEEKKVKITKKVDNNDYKYVEDLLRDKLDTKIKIKDKKIEISFTNVADLNRILEILNVKE